MKVVGCDVSVRASATRSQVRVRVGGARIEARPPGSPRTPDRPCRLRSTAARRAPMSRSLLQLHAGGESPSPGRRAENGRGEEEEETDEEADLDDEADASRLERFTRDRRRARSLPAYPAALLDGVLDGVPEGHGRKRVKFADSMGLNLASVKHFSTLEEPQIPSKVLSRHRSFPPQPQELFTDLCHSFQSSLDRLVSCFPEPLDPDRRVQLLRVCLEKITITQFDVRGQIRVLCGRRGKEVGVRYTFNDWLSHVDAQAVHVAAEEPGTVGERFGFIVYTPPFMDPSSAVHLAVYLKSEEGEFWDNNEGRNYTLRYRCMGGTGT